MKLTFVLRTKKNTVKLTTRSMESFVERIKTDTKDGAVARRRQYLHDVGNMMSYDLRVPSHLIYPSAELEKDANGNLRMRHFNGLVALTVDHRPPPTTFGP